MPQIRWLVDVAPTPADLETPGQWFWPDGIPWDQSNINHSYQQRLIWLPNPEQQRQQALIKSEIGQVLAPAAEKPILSQDVFELRRASGPRDIPLAICHAIALYYGVPFSRDNLIDQINGVLESHPVLNLFNMGQLIASLDLSVSLSEIPLNQLHRVPTPQYLNTRGTSQYLKESKPTAACVC